MEPIISRTVSDTVHHGLVASVLMHSISLHSIPSRLMYRAVITTPVITIISIVIMVATAVITITIITTMLIWTMISMCRCSAHPLVGVSVFAGRMITSSCRWPFPILVICCVTGTISSSAMVTVITST